METMSGRARCVHAMIPIGWGAGGYGDFDRDIDPAPPIASIGDAGDEESAHCGDARGDAGDAGNGGDASREDVTGDSGDDADGGSDPSAGKLKKKEGEPIERPML